MPRTTHAQRRVTTEDHTTRPLREFHTLGREMLAKCPPGSGTYGRGILVHEAEKRGTSYSQLSTARQFARLISEKELDALCALEGPGGQRLQVCHVRALLPVKSKRARMRLAKRAVDDGLSVRQLALEIQREFPKRGQGGRLFILPNNQTALLQHLQSLCLRWRRYEFSFHLERNRGAAEAWVEVSAAVEQAYDKAWAGVMKLEQAIAKDLDPADA